MKQIIGLILATLLLVAGVAAAPAHKPVQKADAVEYLDINGDGIQEEVWLEISQKVTHKGETLSISYFTPHWEQWLGQDVVVNGEIISHTGFFA